MPKNVDGECNATSCMSSGDDAEEDEDADADADADADTGGGGGGGGGHDDGGDRGDACEEDIGGCSGGR